MVFLDVLSRQNPKKFSLTRLNKEKQDFYIYRRSWKKMFFFLIFALKNGCEDSSVIIIVGNIGHNIRFSWHVTAERIPWNDIITTCRHTAGRVSCCCWSHTVCQQLATYWICIFFIFPLSGGWQPASSCIVTINYDGKKRKQFTSWRPGLCIIMFCQSTYQSVESLLQLWRIQLLEIFRWPFRDSIPKLQHTLYTSHFRGRRFVKWRLKCRNLSQKNENC